MAWFDKPNRITDKEQIREIMHAYMLRSGEQKAPFIAMIYQKGGEDWNGRTIPRGGHFIEAARPIGAHSNHETNEITYTLSNRDSHYMSPIGSVNLDGIEYIELVE